MIRRRCRKLARTRHTFASLVLYSIIEFNMHDRINILKHERVHEYRGRGDSRGREMIGKIQLRKRKKLISNADSLEKYHS